jgi:hypothetical protein
MKGVIYLANTPTYDADNISLGPGIVFIGLAGTTPKFVGPLYSNV